MVPKVTTKKTAKRSPGHTKKRIPERPKQLELFDKPGKNESGARDTPNKSGDDRPKPLDSRKIAELLETVGNY